MNNTAEDLFILKNLRLEGRVRGRRDPIKVQWFPPPPGWLKLNIDGSPGLFACGGGFFCNSAQRFCDDMLSCNY